MLSTVSPFVTPNLTANTTYHVRCESGSCQSAFVPVFVTINAPTAPTGTSSPTICSNATASLTATCATGNVAWYGSNSTTLLATTSPFVTPNLTTATTYNVRCESGTCNSPFVAVNVTIEIPPTASITGGGQLTCSTASLNLTASGGGSYVWSNSLGTSNIVSVSSSGTYSVTVTSANGCTATASVVVMQDNSIPNAQITGGGQLTCTTPSLNLTASGGGSYVWSNSLGTSNIVSVSSSGTYSVTVTSANGCTATASVVVMQDNSIPNAQITGGGQLTCITPSLNLTASGVGTYVWSNSLGTSNIVSVSSSGTYSVTVTSVNGCTATASVVVTQDNSIPNAQITGGGQLTCTTPSLNLTASGGGSYVWSNSLGTSNVVSVSSSGTYSVTVTSVNGCTATASVVVTQDNSIPNAQITGGGQLTCTTPSLNLTASGGGSYVWSNSLGTSNVVSVSSSGTYSVTVTSTNGCTATASVVVTFTNDLTITASNTGAYNIGETIQLNAIGGTNYAWVGPNNFSSSIANPTITNALVVNGGIYSVSVTSGICTATATTNVIVLGVDPCTQIIGLQFVKAGNPYQSLFSLTNGMTIQQFTEQVSIFAVPLCPTLPIESVDMSVSGPEQDWAILQNVEPFALFDNYGLNVYGRNFIPGTYTVTITGYAQDNRGGGIIYGPIATTFTIVGNSATISAPTSTTTTFCAGSIVNVNFTTTGLFDSSNQFRVELSDITGGFTNPTIIGMSATAGTVVCQIPQNTVGGSNYLIRVSSSNQVLAGNPMMSFVTVVPAIKNVVTDILNGTTTIIASQQIIASNKVIAPANVTYQAGKSIVLNAGFVANNGTVFKAEIQNICPQ